MLLVLIAAPSLVPRSEAALPISGDDNSNSPKIDLLLSGGGFRAAAFSYGVLAGLHEICVTTSSSPEPRFELREKDEQEKLKPCTAGTPLLDQVNIISAVSGGAITAAYYKTHREEFFDEFPILLKKSNMHWRLLTTEKPPTWKRALRGPVFFLTGIVDFVESLIGLPLSLFNLNIELTPLAVMTFSDGLLEAEQLTTVYRDLFFQNAHLGDLDASNGFPAGALFGKGKDQSSSDSSHLLINATDITNGMVFTFDNRTFQCMGIQSERDNVEVALAVSASSGLPGVFSPLRIDNILLQADPSTIPSDCPPILADRTHKPLLVDGGVTDNLGAIGLLRTVMRGKEGTTTNGFTHHAKDRKEKHLLVVINSETESDSKLPGLAGYFDSSYDVLIRSKKDLVRVITSNMLQNFGFGSVELRLSDLVTADPALVKLTALSHKMKPSDLIPRAMSLVEKEQKIERSLDQIGMLPSSAEIDTLISAGRKVASNRLEDLRRAYAALKNKVFRDNCATIANPDKYWCWPDQFRANDLESGGGSAFLKSLSELTADFQKHAITERHKMFRGILENVRLLGRQEIHTGYKSSANVNGTALLITVNGMVDEASIKRRGSRLHEILKNAKLSSGPPDDCQKAYNELVEDLTRKVEDWKSTKDWHTVWDQLKPIIKIHFKAKCFPEYHLLIIIPKLMDLDFDNPSKRELDKIAGLYEQALDSIRPELNPLVLHQQYGAFLTWYYGAQERGLEHLQISIDLAKETARTLRDILSSDTAQDATLRSNAQNKLRQMEYLRRVSTLHWVSFVLVSPVPIGGHTSKVTKEDIDRWEQTYLHDHNGRSLLDLIGTAHGNYHDDYRTEFREQIKSLIFMDPQGANVLSYLNALREAIEKYGLSPTD